MHTAQHAAPCPRTRHAPMALLSLPSFSLAMSLLALAMDSSVIVEQPSTTRMLYHGFPGGCMP